MPRTLRDAALAAGGLAATAALALAVGNAAWKRHGRRAHAALDALGAPPERPPFTRAELEGLPPPVARYLALAIPEGHPRIHRARVEWSGEFQATPGRGWSPFTATQRFAAEPPGFVWDAKIRMPPGPPVWVRDGYAAGEGSMRGAILGVVPVVDEGGTPEMAASALVRWLGEAVWFPTALLPSDAVRWEPVDDHTARATVVDGAVRVSADFRFAPTGDVVAMTALRYRDVDGTGVPTPFEGRYGRWTRMEGVWIPRQAEAAWILPEGRRPYWRGTVERVSYCEAARPLTAPRSGSPPSAPAAGRRG